MCHHVPYMWSWGMEPGALCMLSTHSRPEPQPRIILLHPNHTTSLRSWAKGLSMCFAICSPPGQTCLAYSRSSLTVPEQTIYNTLLQARAMLLQLHDTGLDLPVSPPLSDPLYILSFLLLLLSLPLLLLLSTFSL